MRVEWHVPTQIEHVGDRGDGRTDNHVCALRAVTSTDGMPPDSYPFDHAFLPHVAGGSSTRSRASTG